MAINVSDNNPRVNYTATSGQTVFTVSFEFFEETDLTVYINGTEKTLTTDYSVTGGDGSTGTITLVTGATASDKVAIVRDVAMQRTTDFTAGQDINREALNEQLDKLTALVADIDDRASRALQLNDHELAAGITLPATDDRKGKVLGFNEITGDVQSGPSLTDVQSLADVSADIATLADIEDGTDATDAIQTAASISSDISTVSGISSNVTTVAGISSDVTAVAADATDIGTVATNISSVNTVATNIADVITVANDLNEAVSEVVTVADDLNEAVSEIDTVAGSITNVNTVGTNIADVNTVAGISANVTTVAGISANTTTVAGISANVTTVAGISSDVTAVAADATDIGTVATSISNVNAVAGNATNINAVAGNATNINTVASDSVNIGTVAGISANVSTVAGLSSSVSTLALISSDITTVAGISANVTTVAGDTANIATIATNLNGTNTIGTVAGSISNVNSVGGAIADVSTVASNLTDVQAFANTYRIGATDPTTSLDEGDLFYNTTSNTLKVYSGSAWEQGVTAGSGFLPLTGGGLTGNLTFGDNDKAIFGAGSDLQIYHDGLNSYIDDAGTGNLTIRANQINFDKYTGEAMARFRADGNTELFYDNAAKLATTSTGIDVTGTVTADGLTLSDADAPTITVTDTTNTTTTVVKSGNNTGVIGTTTAHDLDIRSNNTDRLTVLANGDISFYEDTGTTPKFFWDASAESLGIGVTDPDSALEVQSASANLNSVHFANTSSTGYGAKFVGGGNTSTRYIADFRDYNNVSAFKIDGDGNVGIGTSSPSDDLHIASSLATIRLEDSDVAGGASYSLITSSSNGNIAFSADPDNVRSSTDIRFSVDGSERMRIDSSGNVGIGTTSPSYALDIQDDDATRHLRVFRNASGTSAIMVQNADTGSGSNDGLQLSVLNGGDAQIANLENTNLRFLTNSSERMRLDSGGNVGIGTSSPSSFNGGANNLVVGSGSGSEGMTIYADSASNSAIFFADGTSGATTYTGQINYLHASDAMSFHTNGGTERMRIDSSGNLLVGGTSAYGTSTFTADSGGQIKASASTRAAIFNRHDSDGDIVEFRKADSTVGSIGYESAGTYIDGETNHSGLSFQAPNITPRYNGSITDDTVHLGSSSSRFKDGYFSGTVNAANFNTTSDATLKTNVETLTGSLDAVKALRGVSFDWIENGNSEVGVIAQEVEAVVPDVVSTNDQGIKSVKYGNLVGVLIEAIKEQQQRIEALEAKLGD